MSEIETTFLLQVRTAGSGFEQQGIRAQLKCKLPNIPGQGCRFSFRESPESEGTVILSALDVMYCFVTNSLIIELDPNHPFFSDLDTIFTFAHANGDPNPKRWKIVQDDEQDG